LITSGLGPNVRDMQAVAGFLLTGSVPAPATIIKGVSCVPAGHYLDVRDRGVTARKYWDLNDVPPASAPADIEHIRELLQDSVSRHRMSDVPLGVFLSGGVDSGALVAFAARAMAAAAGDKAAANAMSVAQPSRAAKDRTGNSAMSVAQPFRAADDGVAQAFRPAV